MARDDDAPPAPEDDPTGNRRSDGDDVTSGPDGRPTPADARTLDYAALRGRKRATGLVTAATFANAWEANLALNKLAAEGIPATLADQEIVTWSGGLYSNLAGGIKLQVAAGDVERARAALPQKSAGPAVRCPTCGSGQTAVVPQGVFVRMMSILLLGMPYILLGRRWACGACGHAWRRSIYEDENEERGEDEEEGDEDDREERRRREADDDGVDGGSSSELGGAAGLPSPDARDGRQ